MECRDFSVFLDKQRDLEFSTHILYFERHYRIEILPYIIKKMDIQMIAQSIDQIIIFKPENTTHLVWVLINEDGEQCNITFEYYIGDVQRLSVFRKIWS